MDYTKLKTSHLTSIVIKSYLLHRTFIVKYVGVVPQLKKINSGVPQDSKLRPMLYMLYIANLSFDLYTVTIIYADDTAILVTHNPRSISAFTRKFLLNFQRLLKNGESKLMR
jgi:retron-type reverse transcriptase